MYIFHGWKTSEFNEWISIYDYRFIQRRLLVESRIIETTARYDRI